MSRELKEDGFAIRRDRVRSEVIEPLLKRGMRKARSVRKEDHDEMLGRLAERLAWLEPQWHAALLETIERNALPSSAKRKAGATRPHRDVWPSEAAIMNWARALSPYAGMSELESTYMRSQAGRDAWARSATTALCLARYLRRYGRPPTEAGAINMIRQDADDIDRVVARARDEANAPEARRYVERYERRVADLRSLIFDADPQSIGPAVAA